MKNFITCVVISLAALLNEAHAQNIAINTDGALPDASAMLDIKSTSKGFLAPRMTTTEQNAISSPATGLLIFNTTDNAFKVNTGTPGVPVWSSLGTTVTGTANRITITSNVADISAAYAGQTSITALGTIGTGVWNGTTVGPTYGGTGQSTVTTGDLLYGSASNVWSKLAAGSSDQVLTIASGVPTWATNPVTNNWSLTGNAVTAGSQFLGSTNYVSLRMRTNNIERMVIDSTGKVGIGVTNPSSPLTVKDTIEIRRTGSAISQLLFSNTSGAGDFRISGDGGDLFWQGGGGRNLQLGAYWGLMLAGDRQTGTLPAFVPGVANTGVLVQAQRDASVPLAIQSNSASQTANLTEWRNSSGTILNTINKNGNVAIGASGFNVTYPEKLLVDAGTTTSVNAIVGKGSINSYLQLNIQNNSTGTSASSDVVATANNGSETNNYVDMGINGGNYSGGVMGAANDGYMYTMGNNFLIGTGNASKSLIFMTGGTTQATHERMRLDGSGNLGVGLTNAGYKLTVSAASNPLQLIGLQSGSSADSVLTVQNGVIRRVHPLTLSGAYGWSLSGNTGTASTKLGTTDAFDLPIITNNTTKMTVMSNGNVGIGSTGFDGLQPEKLLVDAGTGASNNIIGAFGEKNSYVQIGVQNRSGGNFASSDIVATADNGTNTSNYIDMGINSSGYSNSNSNILNRANVGYLYSNATADFFIGNGATNQDMILFTNSGTTGNTTANGTEAMRIDASGNVGIGGTSRNGGGVATTNAEKLVVHGNIVPRNSGSGTLGTSTYKWSAVYATNGTIQTSDRRMKTNIANLQYGLKEIMAIQPVSFNWKTTPDSNKKVGLIAQDVQKIIPEVVVGDETKDTLGLNYAELVPVLINAVKEQQKEISELKMMLEKLVKEKK